MCFYAIIIRHIIMYVYMTCGCIYMYIYYDITEPHLDFLCCLFSCCITGHIVGAVLVSFLLPYGFELAMAAASFLMFLGGVIVFVCLTEHPSRVGENVHSSAGMVQ